MAALQGDRRRAGARAAGRRLLAARQVRRRPDVVRAARARRGSRPDLLRPDRPDLRDRALRARARDQVRDLRDHAHQGRDHRRAALAGLGAALGARPRARDRARQRKLEHQLQRAPTDEEMAAELGITVDEFQEALVQISNSTVAALDELWTVSRRLGRPGVAARHAAGPGRARTRAAARRLRAQGPRGRRHRRACPSARSS